MAGAAQPDQPERLARGHGKRDRTHALDGEPLDRQRDAFGRRSRPHKNVAHGPRHDHLHEIFRVRRTARDGCESPAVAKNRHPVGDSEHLIQAMGNVDDSNAALAQPPERSEQALYVSLGQGRGRLIENENVALMASARPMARSERSAAGNDEIGASGLRSAPMMASASAAARRTRPHDTGPKGDRGQPV